MEVTPERLARFFEVVLPHMNEVQRRVVAGATAQLLGRGGKTQVATASGMSRNTVIKAEAEVTAGIEPSDRLRAPGGGDKPLTEKQPGLLEALDELVHPATRGNPMSLLRWTSKSAPKLADELVRKGFEVSARTVLRLLHHLGYSLQANAKVTEGRQHPDRDGQFRYLNDTAAAFIADGQPVISVDTKKKELIGDFANGGAEWAPGGEPERVRVHDFIDPALGKAIPYGIYDLANNEGWVSVGDVADTAEFAVESIRRWWHQMGKARFPEATRLMVTADAGGPTATGFGRGSCTSPAWLLRPGSRSPCATTRRGHRSGTGSSTACSASSPPTGVAAHSSAFAPSSSSSPPRPPTPASASRPPMTRTGTRPASRSPTPNSPPFPLSPTSGTASGTTPSTHNQIWREA